MKTLQNYVDENVTISQVHEIEQFKNITIGEILNCNCDEIFDEGKIPILELENKEKPIGIFQLEIENPKYITLSLLSLFSSESVKNVILSDIFLQLKDSNHIGYNNKRANNYLKIFESLTLKQMISYVNFKKENQLEERKQFEMEFAEIIKIKQEFSDITNENSLIEFFNKYEITPKMLMCSREYGCILDENDYEDIKLPFENLEYDSTEDIVDDFFIFMNYGIGYQMIQTHTLIDSINFLAIFEFKNGLRLGSIGELSCNIPNESESIIQEYSVTLGEFYKLKKEHVVLEIWECVK